MNICKGIYDLFTSSSAPPPKPPSGKWPIKEREEPNDITKSLLKRGGTPMQVGPTAPTDSHKLIKKVTSISKHHLPVRPSPLRCEPAWTLRSHTLKRELDEDDVSCKAPLLVQSFLKIALIKEGFTPKWLIDSEELAKINDSIVPTAELGMAGNSSSYFQKDKEGQIIAIIKPMKEESHKMLGINLGFSALREVLASFLFDNVPSTALVQISSSAFRSFHTSSRELESSSSALLKDCSIQQFIPNTRKIKDLGYCNPLKLSMLAEIAEIDLLVCNSDRHRNNLLIVQNERSGLIERLIPIDHGGILPSNCIAGGKFVWITMIDHFALFPAEIQGRIARISIDDQISLIKRFFPSSRKIAAAAKRQGLIEKEGTESVQPWQGIINTYTICALLLKHLATTIPIFEIAQYYQAGKLHHSILYSILRMAAAKESSFVPPLKETDLVSREHLQSVIQSLSQFISRIKSTSKKPVSAELLYSTIRNLLSEAIEAGDFDYEKALSTYSMPIR